MRKAINSASERRDILVGGEHEALGQREETHLCEESKKLWVRDKRHTCVRKAKNSGSERRDTLV